MKILAWCLGAVVAALIILGASHFASSISPTKTKTGIGLGNHPVIAEVEFDDFTRLQILKIETNQLFDGPTKSSKKTSSFSFGSYGSADETLSNRFSVKSETKNRTLISRQYTHSDAPTGLFLLVNFPKNTSPMNLTVYNGFIRSVANFSQDTKVESLSETFEQELLPVDQLPPFLLLLSDGTGGWHTANGPAHSQKSTDDTSVMVFSTWPHTAKTLQFRIFIPGQPPETFSLPNPSQATTPEKWTASALPQRHRETDFTLTLQSAKLTKVTEQGCLLAIETDFSNRFNGNKKSSHPWEAPLDVRDNEILLNDWGHQATPVHLPIMQGAPQGGGFLVPEDSNIFRLQVPVERTSYFPRKLSDVLIIATAVVEPDGTTIRVISKEETLGLKKLTFSPLKKEKKQQTTQIEADFKWSSKKDRTTKIGSHLKPRKYHFFLFKGSEATSSGGSEFSGSSSSEKINKTITEGITQNWKGTIKPGQTFKVGIAMLHPIQVVDFTFDRSSL